MGWGSCMASGTLVPCPGFELPSSALEVWHLNHWIPREATSALNRLEPSCCLLHTRLPSSPVIYPIVCILTMMPSFSSSSIRLSCPGDLECLLLCLGSLVLKCACRAPLSFWSWLTCPLLRGSFLPLPPPAPSD